MVWLPTTLGTRIIIQEDRRFVINQERQGKYYTCFLEICCSYLNLVVFSNLLNSNFQNAEINNRTYRNKHHTEQFSSTKLIVRYVRLFGSLKCLIFVNINPQNTPKYQLLLQFVDFCSI